MRQGAFLNHNSYISYIYIYIHLIYIIYIYNKSASHSSLPLSGKLSPIMFGKTHIDNPVQEISTQKFVESKKKPTAEYNRQHSTKQILRCYNSFPLSRFSSMEIFLLSFKTKVVVRISKQLSRIHSCQSVTSIFF